jgi:late competence protein required for DNA uptake (superfamily II DNA/RNA helicase)
MSTELVSPEVELEVQEVEEEDKTINDIEQEIECPRCYDVMTLSSNFDRLGYVCQECDFLLFMNRGKWRKLLWTMSLFRGKKIK